MKAWHKGFAAGVVLVLIGFGLLLVMKRGRIISFDSQEKKSVTVFPTAAAIRASTGNQYVFPDFPNRLSGQV